MVTYRNRDPEPSVRFRPPHPVFKVLVVLFCCVQLLAVSAMAVDDDQWIAPEIGFTNVTAGRNSVTIYGTEDRYSLDDSDNAHFESSSGDITDYGYFATDLDLTVSSSGASWNAEAYPDGGADKYLPYDHYESDESTYYYDYNYNLLTMDSGGAWFFSDFYLEPGYYEIDTSFYAEIGLRYLNGSAYYRPVIFELGFENNGTLVKIQRSYSSTARSYFEIKERSRMYIAVTTSSMSQSYHVTIPGQTPPRILYRVHTPTFKYRSIDPVDLAALEQANTNAGNTITDYDNVEQEWTGSMSENFAQLNVGGFSFGDGLISGFGLVSDLFMKVWTALGSYAIVYTFPLYLGIVLVLMGRVNRFIGHLDRKGDNDA